MDRIGTLLDVLDFDDTLEEVVVESELLLELDVEDDIVDDDLIFELEVEDDIFDDELLFEVDVGVDVWLEECDAVLVEDEVLLLEALRVVVFTDKFMEVTDTEELAELL